MTAKKRSQIASIATVSASAASTAANVRSTLGLVLRHMEADRHLPPESAAVIAELRTALRALYAAEVSDRDKLVTCLEVCAASLQTALSELHSQVSYSDAFQGNIDRVEVALASLHSVRESVSR